MTRHSVDAAPIGPYAAALVRSRILAFLLVLAIMPSTGEVLEYVVHRAAFGDAVHHAGDRHGDGDAQGRDKGDLCHLASCSCHFGGNVELPRSATVHAPAVADRRACPVAPQQCSGREDPMPPIRPPIA